MDRKTAITALIGAIKGASEYVSKDEEEAGRVVQANLDALGVLGVTPLEMREAILDAPFLSFPEGFKNAH